MIGNASDRPIGGLDLLHTCAAAGIYILSRVNIFVDDWEREGQADRSVRSSACVCCLQSVNISVSGRANFRCVGIWRLAFDVFS